MNMHFALSQGRWKALQLREVILSAHPCVLVVLRRTVTLSEENAGIEVGDSLHNTSEETVTDSLCERQKASGSQ